MQPPKGSSSKAAQIPTQAKNIPSWSFFAYVPNSLSLPKPAVNARLLLLMSRCKILAPWLWVNPVLLFCDRERFHRRGCGTDQIARRWAGRTSMRGKGERQLDISVHLLSSLTACFLRGKQWLASAPPIQTEACLHGVAK